LDIADEEVRWAFLRMLLVELELVYEYIGDASEFKSRLYDGLM
jgi:hypothetical protein